MLVFSKDRPAQLHALLTSLAEKFRGISRIVVLYVASSIRYQKAYEELLRIQLGVPIEYVRQERGRRFKSALLEQVALIKTPVMSFLVDDMIAVAECDVSMLSGMVDEHTVPSLRHGTNCTYSYAQGRFVGLPDDLVPTENGLMEWSWAQGDAHWAYPLSVDGHLYRTVEIIALLDPLCFRAPNSLENALQVYRSIYQERRGVCHRTSLLVNSPYNLVQSEANNAHGKLGTEWFLRKWQSGYELDWRRMIDTEIRSVHQELPVYLRERRG